MKYFDVKDKLPPIGLLVKVFFEFNVFVSDVKHGDAIRISKNEFKIGDEILKIIMRTTRNSGEIGVTHWTNR